jgi:hypothetical protein
LDMNAENDGRCTLHILNFTVRISINCKGMSPNNTGPDGISMIQLGNHSGDSLGIELIKIRRKLCIIRNVFEKHSNYYFSEKYT